jgi:predicted membrane channel-forming protein YqfA (hemolysin III family)
MILLDQDDLPEGWLSYPETMTGYRFDYSFKEAAGSIFQSDHNEFWMIWSDIFPLLSFCSIFGCFLLSNEFSQMGWFYRILCIGVYFGIISCRICSSVYHIFNCVSLTLNRRLINLDLIGICNMAFGSPWIFCAAFGIRDPLFVLFLVYLVILFLWYLACVSLFIHAMVSEKESPALTNLRQPILISLAVVGNSSSVVVVFSGRLNGYWRLFCFLGVFFMGVGYVLFYINRIPERKFRLGCADGKIYNSHVLWHIFASIGQLFLLITTFLEVPPAL